ncbi:MAG TPA: transcription-repair coupling factor [Opitutaceae bacterium]|jgi:transcription-repair coupling factor (superfamily II helicase)
MAGQLLQKQVGVCPPARGAVIAQAMAAGPQGAWIVVAADLRAAEQLAEDTSFFLRAAGHSPALEALVFPESIPDSRDMREAFAASGARLTVLSRLRAAAPPGSPEGALAIFTTPAALAQAVPAAAEYAASEVVLRRGDSPGFQALLERLRGLDYDSEAVCESPGHYAVRGGIIDVYPVTAPGPYRLDFFGDELEAIRALDPVTQRSGAGADSISIAASPRLRLEAAKAGIADYLGDSTQLVLVEPAALEEQFRAFAGEFGGLGPILGRCASVTGISELDEASDSLAGAALETSWDTESLEHHRRLAPDTLLAAERLRAEEEARSAFLEQLGSWSREGFAVAIAAAKEGEEKRIREIIAAEPSLAGMKPVYLRGGLNEGFRAVSRQGAVPPLCRGKKGLVFATETEFFGRRRVRRSAPDGRPRASAAQVDQLLDFSELVEGDFVVHLQHGIALYRGLTRLDTAQGMREVISLEFDDSVTLHVPLTESHLISRYVGLGRTRPQLGRIGTGRWEKARRAVERATVDLAAELLRVQASREAQAGHAFPADTEWQREFEASFPFTETSGQLRAIEETKSDMERARPMDRLICGDVGFGKTEVAIRAAFKAVQAGKQVIVLVPTTVLAQQHQNTFRERMAGYPVNVEMLSRFRTQAEQKAILASFGTGGVDILIGTHRLLQSDVVPRDLGLLVIDEEQRFGVKHKERFKALRSTVDVLSMSATPIPRTLYLALTGARDMSVIDTPPVNRHPIQTIVKTYDEKVIVDAVRHEMRRGGQVFYLHNRVGTIGAVASRLRQLMPDLSFGVGHGKMHPSELERVMTDFVAGRYSVLVCTTIIESGLDIPNCNTLVIEGADRFGLSQLYQLRGRVGRFRHQAYAYLLLHRHTRLLDIARQRMATLRQHSQLGAGFKIAMRDLELRGAGNLLGAEQSGHIVGVGFELYCQLLRQSVARLKGDKTAAAIRAGVKLDFVFVGEGNASDEAQAGRRSDGYTALKDAEDEASGAPIERVQARIPSSYVAETRLRIDLYRRLAMAGSQADVRKIAEEVADRFGKPGPEMRTLLLVTEIRVAAEQKGIISVESESNRLKCLRGSGQRDDWVRIGTRFPRLTAPRAHLRLKEIIAFLNRLPNP